MKAHLFVAGIPRTGTTMLANCLTDPAKRRWCAVEPGSLSVTSHRRLFHRAALLGWEIKSAAIEDVTAFVDSLDRFGIKEVHAGQQRGALAANPDMVVACVRDMRDVAISLNDPRFVHYRNKPRGPGMANWSSRYLGLLNLINQRGIPIRVVRYADLASSEEERAQLGKDIDWELTGDPSRNLKLYRRGDEAREGIFSRRGPEARAGHQDLCDEVHAACRAYQERFGYA